MNDPIYLLINIINAILTFLTFAIIIRAVLSWIQPHPHNFLIRLLHKVTDPILNPLNRIIPPIAGLDITPMVAIVIIQGIQRLLPRLLGA